jgi:hypothetical protein
MLSSADHADGEHPIRDHGALGPQDLVPFRAFARSAATGRATRASRRRKQNRLQRKTPQPVD